MKAALTVQQRYKVSIIFHLQVEPESNLDSYVLLDTESAASLVSIWNP